ncbi:MAG TPA: choice-of-anchor Q domain-containing protein [Solirubrobacteraceae bacterium]|nr:choice-of-anchor Q domain-containing protein [Solirubrobacteraceae bacterium]
MTTTTDQLGPQGRKCSLREAIATVDSPGIKSVCGVAGRASNTIVLGAGRYRLSIAPQGNDGNANGDLDVTGGSRLTIVGGGKLATVIDATGLGDRVLHVARRATLRLSQLTVSSGHARGGPAGTTGAGGSACATDGAGGDGGRAGSAGRGGGIYNSGTLMLERVLVSDNTAGAGGAGGSGATLDTAGGCTGAEGGAGGNGGGIYNDGKLILVATTIRTNDAGAGGNGGAGGGSSVDAGGSGGGGGAGGRGGGIYNRGRLSVVASTVSQNDAGVGGSGGPAGSGAVQGASDGNGGSGGSGGGILNTVGGLRIVNSTFYANFAGEGGAGGGLLGNGGAGGSGGAVQMTDGVSALRNATVASNGVGSGGAGGSSGGSAGQAGSGGGVAVDSSSAKAALRLQNTIVASSVGAGCAANKPSAIMDGGFNLSYGDASCPGANGDPELGSLGNYGGPTATLPLGSGSAAIDQVPAAGADCPATDQRGVARPQGGECDIGAFEFATPTIDVLAPRGRADYGLGERALAHFRCTEGGIVSPITACTGTVPSGHPINTRTVGVESFDVTAVDATAQEAARHLHYTVLPYRNPLSGVHDLAPGRIDMGVDYGGRGKILALGAGTVIRASDHDPGWPDGGWLMYRLSAGPFAGRYVYVAENITVKVRPGQHIQMGATIAKLHLAYPHLETGWAAGRGDSTLAELDGHKCPCGDPGGWSSIEGRNFNRLLMVLGAPPGYLQPDPPKQRMPAGWPKLHSPTSASIPRSASPLGEGWTVRSP